MNLSKYFNSKPKSSSVQPKDTRPKIFIGIPCHDSRVHSNYMMSVWDLVNCQKYNMAFTKTSSGGITKARNDLANRFLPGDWEYLLFTDTDIQFNHSHLDMMLERNVDIIGAMYPHKRIDLAWSAQHLPEAAIKDGMQEVAGLGFGFINIKRIVFETMRDSFERLTEEFKELVTNDIVRMIENKEISLRDGIKLAIQRGIDAQHIGGIKYRETWNDGRGKWKYGFFQERIFVDSLAGRTDPEWFTEDFFFCYMARRLGFKIHTENRFHLLHHEGGQTFPNDGIMAIADTLMDCSTLDNPQGKKAKEVLHNVLPGWEANMTIETKKS